MSSLKVVAEKNPYNGTWEVGWRSDDGKFTPHFCGYPTKKAAEAEIPGFDALLEAEGKALMAEIEEQEQQFPNLAYVRAQIRKIRDPEKAFDASNKLSTLLDMDRHEHIGWPLPSWKEITGGR